MFQERVGFVPVWTTVGEALREPTGIDGLVESAWTRVEASVQRVMMAAVVAVHWLVFMVC